MKVAAVRKFALALPEAPHFEYASFRGLGGKLVGLRVALAKAPDGVVNALLEQAWRCKAPKALVVAKTLAPIPGRGRPKQGNV